MTPSYHAMLGPSSAHRWRKCTASINASVGQPNDGNDASRMGTACHGAAAECLISGCDAVEFLGREFLFCQDVFGKRYEDFREAIAFTDNLGPLLQHTVVLDDDMIGYVQAFVDFVREQHKLLGGEMLVEQQVPIGHITGEKDARGTSDVILIAERTLVVIDAKFGRNKVVAYEIVTPALPDPITNEVQPPVYAPNDQLALYAGGALEAHRLFNDFETVKLIIVQPPLDHVSEFTMPVTALEAHLEGTARDAEATRSNPTFCAGEHCTYCPARINCGERDRFALTTSLEGFTDVNDAAQIAQAIPRQFAGNMLGTLYLKVDQIRSWCDDIATRVANALNAGEAVIAPDGQPFKLVEGRKGRRAWRNEADAEAALKTMRLKKDEMYDLSLISPTTAEKLATAKKARKGQPEVEPLIGKNQWIKLQRLIEQADPKPVIAFGSDPRPAIRPALDGFTPTASASSADEEDLF